MKRLLPFTLIVLTIIYNIASRHIAVDHLKNGESLVFSVGDDLPEGDYELEYYIACSGTSPAMIFTLTESRAGGEKILLEERVYTVARGFGSSRFTIDGESAVTAEFIAAKDVESPTWAGLGYVRIKDENGAQVGEASYKPRSLGRQPKPLVLDAPFQPDQSKKLSDFATLMAYTVDGTMLNLQFLCTERTATEYELGLTFTCSNINALLPKGESRRFYWLTPSTTAWLPGETYIQSINLKLAPETYMLEAAFIPVSPSVSTHLKGFQLVDSRNSVAIGTVIVSAP